jgi:hypothetical protein
MSDDAFPMRTPTIYESGMTQKEAMHLLGVLMKERKAYDQLRVDLNILSSAVADVVQHVNIQQGHIVHAMREQLKVDPEMIIHCQEELSVLSNKHDLLSTTVSDVVSSGNIQHNHLVGLNQDVAELKEIIHHIEDHPLKYQVAAARNDITSVSGMLQKLTETVTKEQSEILKMKTAQKDLECGFMRHQGIVGMALPNTVELQRSGPVVYRANLKDLQQAPMIAPTPQKASSSTDEKTPMHYLVRKR